MRSRISKDIKRCMTNFQNIDSTQVSAEFIFDDVFIGFQGHFENNPILPGICKILAAVEVINIWKKKELELMEVVFAKFFQPVKCNEKLLFQCFDVTGDGENVLMKIKITHNDKKIAELKLKLK